MVVLKRAVGIRFLLGRDLVGGVKRPSPCCSGSGHNRFQYPENPRIAIFSSKFTDFSRFDAGPTIPLMGRIVMEPRVGWSSPDALIVIAIDFVAPKISVQKFQASSPADLVDL